MISSRSCSWCDSMNESTERECRNCGHDAQVARLECRCARCTSDRAEFEAYEAREQAALFELAEELGIPGNLKLAAYIQTLERNQAMHDFRVEERLRALEAGGDWGSPSER